MVKLLCSTVMVSAPAVSEASWREKTRLGSPPHSADKNRRLACQTKVLGDVRVTKFDGMWGQGDRTVWTPQG